MNGNQKEKVFYKDIPNGTAGMLTDMVNSPPHYADSEIECIDAMVAAFGIEAVQNYAKLNAFKYLWRAGKKDGVQATDLLKSAWYSKFASGDDPRKNQ